MENLEAVKIEPKSGKELFTYQGEELGYCLSQFWSWSQSDLLNNTLRGVLAEFLVRQALGIQQQTRTEWDSFDLLSPEGIRIEVKSSAYLQSWYQRNLSKISFDISPTLGWDKENNRYLPQIARQSDLYVFCLLVHKDKSTVDPTKLDQWLFYMLPTAILNEQRERQKRISLQSLLCLGPQECRYIDLKETFMKTALTLSKP